MSAATSASDRYDAAKAALAQYDEHTEPRSIRDQRQREYRLASALRALIESPAVERSVEEITEQLAQKYQPAYFGAENEWAYKPEQLIALLEATYQAGVQAAWESWEPENAPGLVDEARYDRIEGAIRLAFEGEGEAWSDKLSGDRLASVARRAIEEAGL